LAYQCILLKKIDNDTKSGQVMKLLADVGMQQSNQVLNMNDAMESNPLFCYLRVHLTILISVGVNVVNLILNPTNLL
jgi:hypothetical protein